MTLLRSRWAPGIARTLAAALVILLIIGFAPAATATVGPVMTLSGEPTPAEQTVIDGLWGDFAERFSGHWACMTPLEVVVVGRVEDVYGSTKQMAAFYQFPPEPKVFIEHGKVDTDHLVHEFAHHLDISCGLGSSSVGRSFLQAQGLAVDRPWLDGPSWAMVPAEMFAEAVVTQFGEPSSIYLTEEAIAVAAGVAGIHAGDEVPPDMYGYFRVAGLSIQAIPALLARAFFTGSGVVGVV